MNPITAALSPQASAPPASAMAPTDDGRSAEFARYLERARDGDAAQDRDAPTKAPKEAPPKDATDTDAAIKPAADATEAPGDEATAPDLSALLPGWSPPPAVTAATAPTNATATATTTGADAIDSSDALPATPAATAATPSLLQKRDDAATRAAAPVESAQASDNLATTGLPTSAQLQAAVGEHKDLKPGASAALAPTPTAGALSVASPTTIGHAFKAGETMPPTATLATPIDTPQFAPTLATQVRWWAHQGVQQAQLLLNPAEMGPVAVKIVLDGREARIDFSADLAATRGAIEAALPVLAAALDDSGLKLSGGGVHDGSAQRQPEWMARSATQRSAAGTSAREGQTSIGPTDRGGAAARGLVDLVA